MKTNKQHNRELYWRRRAAHLCPKCGQPSGERVFCVPCRTRLANAPSQQSSSVKFLNRRDRWLRRVLYWNPRLRHDPIAVEWIKGHLEVFVPKGDIILDKSLSLSALSHDKIRELGGSDA